MRIRIVYNRIFPFGDNRAMTVWPCIFTRVALKDYEVNHELTHCQQQKEVMVASAIICLALVILGATPFVLLTIPFPFYILYLLEYVIRLCIYRNHREAYRNISTEQEAYLNQMTAGYPMTRNDFAWVRFIFRKTYNR